MKVERYFQKFSNIFKQGDQYGKEISMGRLNIKPGEIIVYAKKNGVQNDISQKCNVGNATNEMYTQMI